MFLKRLGLVSSRGMGVSVSSRSRRATSCLHPWDSLVKMALLDKKCHRHGDESNCTLESITEHVLYKIRKSNSVIPRILGSNFDRFRVFSAALVGLLSELSY